MLAARYDAARDRLRTGAEATQRAAARRRPRRRRAHDARRVRRAARARRRPSSCGAACGSSNGWRRRSTTPTRALAGGDRAGDRARTRRSGRRRRSTDDDADDDRGRSCAPRSSAGAGPRSNAASRSSARTATSCDSTIGGLDARTQASQGEQRTLALALRLAGHEVVTELTGTRAGAAARRRVQRARRAPARPRSCATCPPARRC